MKALRIILLVTGLVPALPGDFLAQQATPIAPGDRVRVTAPAVNPGPLHGTVVSMDPDSVVLEVEGREEPLAFSAASITALDVSRGQKGEAVLGGILGGIAGVILGVSVYNGSKEDCGPEDSLCELGNFDDSLVVLALAGVGAGVGALIGSLFKSERWEAVPLDEIHVTALPLYRGGVAVSASIKF